MQNCSPNADDKKLSQCSTVEEIEALLAQLNEAEQKQIVALTTGYFSALSNSGETAPKTTHS